MTPSAGDAELPARLDREALASHDQGRGYWLDVRDQTAFASGHIRGALNVALRGRLDTWTGIAIPFDAPIVIVGNEDEVREAAFRLRRIGLDNLTGWAPPDAEAWTVFYEDGKGDRIFVYTRSRTFRCASVPSRDQDQCQLKLASVIVHEAWHLRNGLDEVGAYEAELAAWGSAAVPLAAALNGVKGCQQVLRRRRSWGDDVEPTLLNNGIDRETLEAMQQACVEAFPDFRRYLQAKARRLGLERLAWYDINAPVAQASRVYAWAEAEAFVREQFGRYSERMAGFAERSFRERSRWIARAAEGGWIGMFYHDADEAFGRILRAGKRYAVETVGEGGARRGPKWWC